MNLIEQFTLHKNESDDIDPLSIWRTPADPPEAKAADDAADLITVDTGAYPGGDERTRATDPDAPPATVIATSTLAAKGLIVPGGPRTRSVHEFRTVKRSLLLCAMADETATAAGHGTTPSSPDAIASAGAQVGRHTGLVRRLMVTSALPNEGKTFSAANLALSLAEEKDWRVLLVDADVARPSLSTLLEIPQSPGLMDALVDPRLDILDLVQRTSVPNLSYLGAGRIDAQATELLSSDAMARIMARLTQADARRILVFDSPPLLVTTEAGSLARHMGQIVLVVETGVTPRKAVHHALELLDGNGADTSILLNKAPERRKAFGYGTYGYGYGYAQGN